MTDFTKLSRLARHHRLDDSPPVRGSRRAGIGGGVAVAGCVTQSWWIHAAAITLIVSIVLAIRAHVIRRRRLDANAALQAIGRSFAGLPFKVVGWRDYLLADYPTIDVATKSPADGCALADAANVLDRHVAVATVTDRMFRVHLPTSAVADLGNGSLTHRLLSNVLVPLHASSEVEHVRLGGLVMQ